jgi:hypothetical protein
MELNLSVYEEYSLKACLSRLLWHGTTSLRQQGERPRRAGGNRYSMKAGCGGSERYHAAL